MPLARQLILQRICIVAILLSGLYGCSQGDGGGSSTIPSIDVTLDYLLNNKSAPAIANFRLLNTGASNITWNFGDDSSVITGGAEISYQYQNGNTFLVQAFSGSELIAFRTVSIEERSLNGQIFTDRIPYIRDRDTNDQRSTPTSNNSALEGQTLTLGQRVIGHLRLPSALMSTAISGALSNTGDDQDWYQVDVNSTPFYLHLSTLSATNQIRMSVYDDSDPSASALWTNTNVSGSALTVELSGLAGNKRYWVALSLEGGEFENYLLSSSDSSSAPSFQPQDPYVIGQAIVRFKQPSLTASTRSLKASTVDNSSTTNIALMDLTELNVSNARNLNASHLPKVDLSARFLSPAIPKYPRSDEVDAATREATLEQIRALNKHPDVAIAEPNYIRTLVKPTHVESRAFSPTDSFFNLQWHYPQINVNDAWSLIGAPTVSAGAGVEIAIIDTGNLPQHPDYSQTNEGCNGGFDFISSPFQAMDGDGWDSNPTDLGDLYLSYHGSHVSGTIGANTQNSLGVAGIAWGASLCHLRVLGLTGGTEYDLIQAILYASALPGDYEAYLTRRSQPVDIINLSLGGGSYSSAENSTIQAAIANGVIVVAAMGNDGSTLINYPAAYSGVISVGATDSRGKIASYSNVGAHIDVSAPGGELYCPTTDGSCFSGQAIDQQGDGYPDGVLSLFATGYGSSINYGYAYYEGTSMATPHMSSVIALMKQQHPALNTQLLTALLQQGLLTQDMLATGFDTNSGYGEIDALKAVLAAQNLSSAPPSQQMLLSNAAPIFTQTGTTSIDITNLSTSTVQVASVQKAESWLTVTPNQSLPITLTPNQSFSLTINATLDELSVGDSIAMVTIEFDDATQRSFPVIASLPPLPLTSVGDVYVVLLDQSGDWPTYVNNQWQYAIQRLQPDSQGHYHFSFNSAGSGDELDNFLLYASTDLDGDGELCDFGEFCAGLDFSSIQSFQINHSQAVKNLYGTSMFDSSKTLKVKIPDDLNP